MAPPEREYDVRSSIGCMVDAGKSMMPYPHPVARTKVEGGTLALKIPSTTSRIDRLQALRAWSLTVERKKCVFLCVDAGSDSWLTETHSTHIFEGLLQQ